MATRSRGEFHLVIGTGAVGQAITRELVARGENVRTVSRSGRALKGAVGVPCDATNAEALTGAARGAVAVYNAAAPSRYREWPRVWPRLASSALEAAGRAEAILATVGNLHVYGPLDGPMTEGSPLEPVSMLGRVRRASWLEARSAHDAGRVRVVEARASNFVGEDARSFFEANPRRLTADRRPRGLGRVDADHSWTSPVDVARTLVAAVENPRAHGLAWHVPSPEPRTQQQYVDDLAEALGVDSRPIAVLRKPALRALGLAIPALRGFVENYYQYAEPFVVDDAAARREFGIEPQPWSAMIESSARAATVGAR
jgi:nucleoside-diphosphate-sugar epimerase